MMFGRRALIVTAGITLLVGMILGLFPSIDFEVSDFFEDTTPSFDLRLSSLAVHLRIFGMVLPACVAGLFIAMLLVKLLRPQARLPIDARGLIAVLATFLLGPVLLVNVVLKEHWGRERPSTVVEQVEQGEVPLTPWWAVGGPCRSNCSFASGEVSSAAVLIAAAAVLPAAVAGVTTAAAVAITIAVALLRLAFGGHFLSDVLLAALFTHLIAIVMLRLMHDPRWWAGRPGAIEARLAARRHRHPPVVPGSS